MNLIKKGDKIKVDYEGTFENGETFDSSKHGSHSHPLEFVVGEGQVIKGFDDAVIGMKKGDKKEISIEPKEAYGERREELKQKVPRSELGNLPELKKGMILMMQSPDGRKMPLAVADADEQSVTLDLNHPLAGKKLIFKIEILSIQ